MQCIVAVEVQSWEILTQAHMTLKPDVLSASVRKGHKLLFFLVHFWMNLAGKHSHLTLFSLSTIPIKARANSQWLPYSPLRPVENTAMLSVKA